MRKKKRRISDFTNFAPEFVEDFTNETPKDINLRNYLDDEDQRKMRLKELDREQTEREEAEKIEESINNNDDVAQAAQYVKELLWEFGDEIKKKIEIDKNNILYVEIRPPHRPINTLDDLKTGNYIMIGEEFVERLQSIALMLNEVLKLVNIFEITWTNVTKEGNKIIKRTRKRTKVEKKYIPKMVEKLKDKPNHEVRIHEVRITAGKPVK